MHELLQVQIFSPFGYKFLILIETLQMLLYSIHSKLNFLFTTQFILYIRSSIRYLQVKKKFY